MARPKIYTISLTDDELKTLKSVMRKKQTPKTVRNRCQIIIAVSYTHLGNGGGINRESGTYGRDFGIQ